MSSRQEKHHEGGWMTRLRKDGRLAYYARVWWEGKFVKRRVALGPVPGRRGFRAQTKRIERRVAAEQRHAKARAEKGLVPFEPTERVRRPAGTPKTIADALKTFLKALIQEGRAAQRERSKFYGQMTRCFEERFGDRKLSDVKTAELREWISERGWSPSSVRKVLSFVDRFYRWAGRELDYPGESPASAERYRRPSEGPGRNDHALTREQAATVERLLREGWGEELYRHRAEWVCGPFRLALLTGMRRQELLGLRWEQITRRGRGDAYVELKKTKTGRPRLVPLSNEALNLLKDLPERIDGYVFGSCRGLPLAAGERARTYSRAVKRALKQAAVELEEPRLAEFRPHDTRHTAATWAAEAGADIAEVAALLGHSTLDQARAYVHAATTRRGLLRKLNSL